MKTREGLYIGTCSWKYPSWKGLVYSAEKGINYLEEYARKYRSVEVDQWFWSLFADDKVILPQKKDVDEYAAAVPADFMFSIKAPNSITLTHLYKQYAKGALAANPHFLSTELYHRFIDSLGPLARQSAMIILQFEYLNKQKMCGQTAFQTALETFINGIRRDIPLALEVRNPQYLNRSFIEFLNLHAIVPVLMQGYFMPDIVATYSPLLDLLETKLICIRLMGNDREGIEQRTGKRYDRIVDDRDEELEAIAGLMLDLLARGKKLFTYTNNHYEGSAPLSADRLIEKLNF